MGQGAGDDQTRTLITRTYQRAGAFLFGRRTYELFPGTRPDMALDLAGSRADSKGVTIQVYRSAGRPRYAVG